jgi:hypothetical protein
MLPLVGAKLDDGVFGAEIGSLIGVERLVRTSCPALDRVDDAAGAADCWARAPEQGTAASSNAKACRIVSPMGYDVSTFPQMVGACLQAGWLFPGARLIEFGSQEFFGGSAANRQSVGEFLRSRNVTENEISAALGNADQPSVAAVYRAIGLDYTAIDVDGARGSTFFDLNIAAPPPEWRNAFDFVNNEGTAEHLINPINAFHVAHDIAKVGGVIRHSFPLIGYQDHGFFYPTGKFCAHLVGDNGYEVLRATALVADRPSQFNDTFFAHTVRYNAERIVETVSITDIWALLIYRKTKDTPFVIPADHLDGNGTALRKRLDADYHALARLRPSAVA